MAMLAEPRRRKKYNLCPRGKALYEDSARFGTKMLEKMGWSKGRGLGANEDGSQDFVRVRFKNDAEGLGYENRDDQWTIHEEGFNGLLNSLNGGSADDAPNTNDNSGAASASEDEARPMGFGFREATPEKKVKSKTLKNNISGVSLEEKSKQSKARVHYKKFTRGKDLSRYSEKDLANIFGKKATEDIDAPIEPVVPAEQQPAEEEKPVDPNFAGVHTVSTGLSVNDYFKQKMEAMKNRLKNNSFVAAEEATPLPNGDGEAALNDAEEVAETAQPEKKKKKSKRAKKEEEETVIESSPVTETASKIKKKKKSKEVVEEAEAEPEVEAEIVSVKEKKEKKKSKRASEEEQSELTEEKPPPKKKSKHVAEEAADEIEVDSKDVNEVKQKKSKHAPEEDAEQAQEAVEATPSEESATKEKTKKKSKRAAEETATVEQQPKSEVEAVVKEKKKKSKRAAEEIEEKQQPEPEVKSIPSDEATSKEKKKKSKRAAEADTIELEQQVEEAEETSQPKRKKKKKDKQDEDVDVNETKETPVEEETNKKSKKKKKPENHENVEVSAESSSSDADTESDNSQYLSYEELIKKRDSFNVCPISSFCAEKFYIFDMKAYRNSTIAHITGYDVDENIKLKVVQAKNDNLRIFNLWEGKTSKYINEPKVGITKPKHKHKAAVRAVKKRQLFSGI
ncbi:titin isoform X1 [Drosophila albomicans]|uniref:Titin isoform X1 n=1 Tax=Drosophila albomicans TaxID=7291 RepID=A0A6P8X505_DROAB|nr:titin isoform X1 [Drosophila albomicans]